MNDSNLLFSMAELSSMLFYADYLSMLDISIPVTDTCKYFYVHGIPMNICFIADTSPFYDENNPYFKLAVQEYMLIKDKFGEDGILSFVETICNMKSCGMVSGERMLQCIHKYSPRKTAEKAYKIYLNWKNSLTYKHIIKDDDGKSIVVCCGKSIAHVEKTKGLPIGSNILPDSRIDEALLEETIKTIKR